MGAEGAGSADGGARLVSSIIRLAALTLLLVGAGCSGGEQGASPAGGEQSGVFATLESEHSFPEPFSYLSGVRELPDGTLLAADPASVALLMLNPATGRADTLGRTGEGPEEYGQPDHVFPLPGDSTLLVDLGNGRLTVMDPEGAFVRWMPMTQPTEDGSLDILHPTFVDNRGSFYELAPRGRDPDPPDSTAVVRFDRFTLDQDTVAWLWRPEMGSRGRGAPRPILLPMDDWAVGPDGRIAMVRANGVSVDWYLPGEGIVPGPGYEFETYPVGEEEKMREVDLARSSAILTMATSDAGGTRATSMSRGIPAEMAGEVGLDAFDWPQVLPAFQPMATLVSPSGEAWVTRMMPVNGPGRIEVFDGEGVHQGYVETPPSSRVIGFGARPETEGMVYLVRTDDVGLKWLERYRLVRNRSGERLRP